MYRPTQRTRLYAMLHIAIHDALNTINRRFQPYVLDIAYSPRSRAVRGFCAGGGGHAAAHDVLVPVLNQMPVSACIDAGIASVEADYNAALDAIADGALKTQGVVIGHARPPSSWPRESRMVRMRLL